MHTYNEEDDNANEILMELARIKELEEVQVRLLAETPPKSYD